MAPTVTALPARYAKFITVTLGQALVYLQTYGWAWEIKPAATMAAVALAVLAVPNAARAPAAAPPVLPPVVSMTPVPPPMPPPTGSQI
jgi:hypothetical protein